MWRLLNDRVVLITAALLALLAALYVWFFFIWPIQKLNRSFNNLERNAKRVITGTQLQTWAVGLLSAYPTNSSPRVSELGTNFPPQLLSLYHRPPSIGVYQADTNWGGHVQLLWGGGFIGVCGFDIGATNYVSCYAHARAWQPGVYFVK
jgi:hypothetical protein